MSEAELVAAAASWNELALDALVFYVSIVFGYLVVAHLIGTDLKRRQLIFVNSLFIVFSLFAVWGTYDDFRISAYFWVQSEAGKDLHGESPLLPHHLVVFLQLIGILASLNFMREKRAENYDSNKEG